MSFAKESDASAIGLFFHRDRVPLHFDVRSENAGIAEFPRARAIVYSEKQLAGLARKRQAGADLEFLVVDFCCEAGMVFLGKRILAGTGILRPLAPVVSLEPVRPHGGSL